MSSNDLDNLVKVGTLKVEPGAQSEFDGLLALARNKLADVPKDLSAESQFDLAYGAAHALSLAAMRWHGYRPNNARFVVFQALQHTLGIGPEIWRVLDKGHALRNLAEYAGSFSVDKQLLADLIGATRIVQAAVEKLGPIPQQEKKK
jgi:hypothetical protein